MDVNFFKNRGKTWMGDIYQKVEGMLQDVDGVINQGNKTTADQEGKTSKMSVDNFISEVIQGLHIVNPSTSNQKNNTDVKSSVKVENKPFVINSDQSLLGPTIIPKDKLSESDNTTIGISNLLLDVEDKPKVGISEKSEMEPPIFSGPDVNKPGVSTESVECEDGKTISEEPISMEMIVNENFMSNKYDEVNNHFSIETFEVKAEPFPFSEDTFDTSVNLLEDNAKEAGRSGLGTEGHTYQNANAVYDQFLEETEGLLIPECVSPDMGNKSSINHHNDNAANLKFNISPMVLLSSPSGPSGKVTLFFKADYVVFLSVIFYTNSDFAVGNTCAENDKISGFHSYKKKNLQIQVPSDKPVDDLTEFGMETVDLHDKAAMEESSSFIDAKELYAVSKRVQKLRSFREKIQDAFTTKRRLAKEYEQLSIWYGDIDFDGSNQYRPQDRPPTAMAVSDAQNQQKHQLGDSEWVIL